jgi:hypothetical protein
LASWTRIASFEIDDVAQEDLALGKLVAPDDDGLEGERALAQPRDHGLAAGLDSLGDRNLALAREKLHRAHLAQIHPHRVVSAPSRFLGLGLDQRHGDDLDEFPFRLHPFVGILERLLLVLFGFLRLHYVDAHLAEQRQEILDLLGMNLPGGQHRIDLIVGHVAAPLGASDEFLDGFDRSSNGASV